MLLNKTISRYIKLLLCRNYIVVFCLACVSFILLNASSGLALSRVTEMQGKFFCPPNGGKLVVRDSTYEIRVVCLYNGEKFNALTGMKLLPEQDKRFVTDEVSNRGKKIGIYDTENTESVVTPVETKKNNKKKLTVVNNYYEEVVAPIGEVPMSNNMPAKRKYTPKKRPYTGVYMGIAYNFNFVGSKQQYGSNDSVDGSFTSISNSIQATSSTFGFLFGGNIHFHDKGFVGLEVYLPVLRQTSLSSQVPIGSLNYSYISSITNVTSLTARVGWMPVGTLAFYLGAGAEISQFNKVSIGNSSLGTGNVTTVSPRISAGVEILLWHHMDVRLEYSAVIYVPSSSTTYVSNAISESYSFSGSKHSLNVILSYKF